LSRGSRRKQGGNRSEYLIAITTGQGNRKLSIQQSVSCLEVIPLGFDLNGEIPLALRNQGESLGQQQVVASGREQLADYGVDSGREHMHSKKREVVPGPESRHHESLFGYRWRRLLEDRIDVVHTEAVRDWLTRNGPKGSEKALVRRPDG
jgi:hypothetical protein